MWEATMDRYSCHSRLHETLTRKGPTLNARIQNIFLKYPHVCRDMQFIIYKLKNNKLITDLVKLIKSVITGKKSFPFQKFYRISASNRNMTCQKKFYTPENCAYLSLELNQINHTSLTVGTLLNLNYLQMECIKCMAPLLRLSPIVSTLFT